MKIVLLGYMGSGKTTVGKKLASRMKLQFLDLDDYIQKSEKMDIPDIFQNKGELYFRKKEHFYLEEVLKEQNNFVLSTGGGTPCYGTNLDTIIKGADSVIYLKVSIGELATRLSKGKSQRPLIQYVPLAELPEFIGKHLFERNPYYNRANLVVLGDAKTPEVLAKEIEKTLG